MEAIEGNPLESLARWYTYVYGDGGCFDPSYETIVERYSNEAWDQIGTDNGSGCFYFSISLNIVKMFFNLFSVGRQWLFLQCTQIGSFLVADQYTWLPGTVDFNFHLQKCEDLFGVP